MSVSVENASLEIASLTLPIVRLRAAEHLYHFKYTYINLSIPFLPHTGLRRVAFFILTLHLFWPHYLSQTLKLVPLPKVPS